VESFYCPMKATVVCHMCNHNKFCIARLDRKEESISRQLYLISAGQAFPVVISWVCLCQINESTLIIVFSKNHIYMNSGQNY